MISRIDLSTSSFRCLVFTRCFIQDDLHHLSDCDGAPAFHFRHSWKRRRDLTKATGISMAVSLVLSNFSEVNFQSSACSLAAAWLMHPYTRYLEVILIKPTFSLYWKLVLLTNIAGRALIERRHYYQEPSVPRVVPNSAPDVQNGSGDIRTVSDSVLVPRVPNADNPANRESATPTGAVTTTQPPSGSNVSCQKIGQCNVYASVY